MDGVGVTGVTGKAVSWLDLLINSWMTKECWGGQHKARHYLKVKQTHATAKMHHVFSKATHLRSVPHPKTHFEQTDSATLRTNKTNGLGIKNIFILPNDNNIPTIWG